MAIRLTSGREATAVAPAGGQRTGNDGHEQPFKDARQMISDRATRDGDGFA
jgi:hypothetical protein